MYTMINVYYQVPISVQTPLKLEIKQCQTRND